jgi:predicted ATPase
LYGQGELASARQHLEHGMALYSPQMHRAHLPTQDPGVNCLGYGAMTLAALGYADQALARVKAAYDLVQELSHPYSAAWTQIITLRVHMLRGDLQTSAELADAIINLATAQGFNLLLAQTMVPRGWTRAMQGQVEEGLGYMRQGFEAYQATGAGLDMPFYLSLLAEAYGQARQPEAGLRVATKALTLVEQHDEHYYEAELYRLQGELLLRQSSDHAAEVETCFYQAITIAQGQSAKSWELRAAMSLARLWQSQGKRQDAYDLLAPVYGWFTEGFDMADLKDARSLLGELSAEKVPPTA